MVEKFIENFKKGFNKEEVENIFLNGNCYHFALILKQMFKGEIIYDPHEFHFSTKIKGKYYDITGEIQKPYDECSWKDMKEEDYEEYLQLRRICVYKME